MYSLKQNQRAKSTGAFARTREILSSSGTGQDKKMQAWRDDQKVKHGTDLLQKLKKTKVLDQVVRADHASIKTHAMERPRGEYSDSESLDSDDEDLLNDPLLDNLYKGELREVQADMVRKRRRAAEEKEGNGIFLLCAEKEALDICAQNSKVVLMFHLPTFDRCNILAGHFKDLAKKFPQTRFIAVRADMAKFLSDKMKVKTLPTTILCVDGKVTDKLIGFEEFGGEDGFSSYALQFTLQNGGVIPDKNGKFRQKAPRTDVIMSL